MSSEEKKDIKNNSEEPKNLDYYFRLIESYFKKKEAFIREYKHIPLEVIIKNAPKYYSIVRLIESINIFLTKDKLWLQHFVERNKINFNWKEYEIWKAGKSYDEAKYDETLSPAKWIHVLQEFFIDLLKDIQILLVMEFYIDEDDYKKFIKRDSHLYYKIMANYKVSSKPTEELSVFFKLIDYILNLNVEYNFSTNLVIDTALCMKVYREVDNSKIIDLLKRKEFYVKYHVEYLKKTSPAERSSIPYEKDVIKVAEKFLLTIADLRFTYSRYKMGLIQKKESFMKKNK
ncbi:MAG: hypothetical protein JXB50_16295 [Spirochaetes bacterium]|nr:hypothetical protein [Spirochaetota bacterium]